jgi:hypothetical protein
MRSFLAVIVATMTEISATPLKRQCPLRCQFLESSECDITLSAGQSACCGNAQALHCFIDGTQSVDDCNNNSFCELFTSGSIKDCRCGTDQVPTGTRSDATLLERRGYVYGWSNADLESMN